jgi:hypothetical protein
MSRSIRLATAAAAALAAFAFTGPALAAYSPRLIIVPITNAPGRPASVILGHSQDINDDATAKDTIYAPLGYQVNLTQAVGSKIGDVEATLVLRQGGNAELDVDGEVIVDNAAAHPSDPCAPGLHQAVWKLNIAIAGTPLTVYVYVDPVTSGPEATFASAKIQLCLAGPIGTPAGAQLLYAVFRVDGVFTNPANTQPRLWRGVFTPYFEGTATPNPAGTVEGQAQVPGRATLTLSVKSLRHGRIILSGRLLADGRPVSGGFVEIYVGQRRVARVRTNSSGRFTVRKRIKKKTRYQALLPPSWGELASCPAAPLPTVPMGCKSATFGFTAVSNRVTARRRR